jgi:hypothetical protein
MMAPALPGFTAKPKADPTTLVLLNKSLADAEHAFSERAQVVGLRKAFHEYGRDDSMNMYSGAGFTIGRDAISANFKEEGPAKIHWGTERSFVASSGDLGVSIGTIYPKEPGADGKPQPGFPFFTVWKRDTPNGPWRYVAE